MVDGGAYAYLMHATPTRGQQNEPSVMQCTIKHEAWNSHGGDGMRVPTVCDRAVFSYFYPQE